ncbi:MAG: GYD domain-containing protein [Candidatus Bathyarchaeia archaeon]
MRTRITKDIVNRVSKIIEEKPKGVTIRSIFWTLGRYDVVWYVEAPDEKAIMSVLIQLGDAITTETLVAVPREEALKMLG